MKSLVVPTMKFLAMAALTFSALITSSPAQTLTDTFSGSGGAWTAANQPDFTGSAGGTLYSDQAIAAGTNNSALNTDATLTVGGGLTQGGNIFSAGSNPPGFLYVGGSTPALTLSTSNILDGTNNISLSIAAAFGTFSSNSTTLSLDGNLSAFSVSDTGAKAQGTEIFDYTWTWGRQPVRSN